VGVRLASPSCGFVLVYYPLCPIRRPLAAFPDILIRQSHWHTTSPLNHRQFQSLFTDEVYWSFVPLFAEDRVFSRPLILPWAWAIRWPMQSLELPRARKALRSIIILPFLTSFLLGFTRSRESFGRLACSNLPAVAGCNRPLRCADHAHEFRGLPRNHLFLSAFHGLAPCLPRSRTGPFLASKRPPI